MNKRWFAASILSIILLAATGSYGQDTVRIGVFLPMTGGVASYGQMEWAGMNVAKAMKPTVLGKKVELFLVDEKSDRIEAANAVNRLISKNKVHALIGSATSSNTMAGAAIAEKFSIPLVSPTATDPRLTQNKKYIFRVCFIDSFQGKMAARYAFDTLKARRAALLVDVAQDACVDLANEFKKNFTKKGGQIVQTTYCQSGDQDFTAQLAALKAAKPDVLYLPNYYPEDALICKQTAEVGLKTIILSSDGAHAPELIAIGGKAVEGFTMTGHFEKNAVTSKLGKAYLQQFAKTGKSDVGGYEALGADAYFILLNAIERARSTDGAKVRAALASTRNFEGVSGTIQLGEDGNAVKSLVVMKVKDGKFTYIATLNPE